MLRRHCPSIAFLVLSLHALSAHPHAASAFQPQGASYVGTTPRIYIYNNSQARRNWVLDPPISMYSLEITFPDMVLRSPYYEPDPEQAHYFYVHTWIYHDQSHAAFDDRGAHRMDATIAELKQLGPWWETNRSAHIFPLVTDRGICSVPFGPNLLDAGPKIKDAILLQHYGGTTQAAADPVACDPKLKWGAACDPLLAAADAPPGLADRTPPCYVKGKDLLVPTVEAETTGTSRYFNQTLARLPQAKLMFFSGMVDTMFVNPKQPWQDAGYSLGVRQTVMKLYANDMRMSLPQAPKNGVNNMNSYYELMAGAIFCLAPTGLGWGSRVKTAITRGCIPVIMQDGVKVEFEDELPYEKFALRIPFAWVHKLPEILEHMVEEGRVAGMQKNLRCVWPLFWWSGPWGQAFEMAMCILRARTHGWTRPQIKLGACTLKCAPDEKPWKIHRHRRRGDQGRTRGDQGGTRGDQGLPAQLHSGIADTMQLHDLFSSLSSSLSLPSSSSSSP